MPFFQSLLDRSEYKIAADENSGRELRVVRSCFGIDVSTTSAEPEPALSINIKTTRKEAVTLKVAILFYQLNYLEGFDDNVHITRRIVKCPREMCKACSIIIIP